MLTLLRLGAVGDYAKQLDSQIDDLVRPGGKENPELPQSKVDEDKAWAEETYSKYFSSSPRLEKTPFPCVKRPRQTLNGEQAGGPTDHLDPGVGDHQAGFVEPWPVFLGVVAAPGRSICLTRACAFGRPDPVAPLPGASGYSRGSEAD